jgi:hypothetical protein
MLKLLVRSFTAAASGSASKVVHCEHCATDYVYQVRRQVIGDGVSALLRSDRRAKDLATMLANQELQKALDLAVEVVPCPACGWIQGDMKTLARCHYLRRTKIAGIVLLSLLVVPLLMFVGTLFYPPDKPASARDLIEIAIFAFFLLAAGGGLLIARSMACSHFDPNDGDLDARLRAGRERAVLLADVGKHKSAI